jgi:hypothetical protein
LVRKLAGGTAGQLAGSEPCDKGGLGLLSDPTGRNKVKPEQASKVLMRMPTLRSFGEGCTCGEEIDKRTHAIRRGSGYGTSVGWFVVTGGDPSWTRVAALASHQAVVTTGVGRGNRSVDAG